MNKSPKFIMMIATAGLAFSMAAHANDNDSQNYTNQGPNASLEDAKALLGKTFNLGKGLFSAVINSEPAQQIKGVAVNAAVGAYKSEAGQQIKGVAVNAYNSESAQQIKGAAVDAYNTDGVQQLKKGATGVISAGKDKLSDVSQGISDYKQGALSAKGLNEASSDEAKAAAYSEANGAAVKSFFGGLLNKTKELTNSAATVVQQATVPQITPTTDPIAEIAQSEKVKAAPVVTADQTMQNVQSIRAKMTSVASKVKMIQK